MSGMPQISVTINGRDYQIACDDGQEAHVGRLGRYIDQKVGSLVRSVGQIGDARLLVMASLLIADELAETDQALSQLKGEASASAPLRAAKSEEEAAMATALDGLAARLEAIADALERD